MAPAVAWLREKSVDTERIADAFGITPTHVRVLAWRGRLAEHASFEVAEGTLGARPDDGTGILTATATIEQLEYELDVLRIAYEVERRDYSGALRAYDAFRPRIGRPGSTAMKRILARWYAQRAWFAVHGGFTTTAIDCASKARRLYHRVYRESRDVRDLKSLANVLLVESHAHLYVNQPRQSQTLLAEFRTASERAGSPLGSDYHRQLGTAYALEANQHNTDRDLAHRVLKQVPIVMQRIGDAELPHDAFFAARQQYLLGRVIDIDGCHALVEIAKQKLEEGGLRWLIAKNYLAAAQLSLEADSTDYIDALNTLTDLESRTRNFPLQGAVRYLLSVTPRLQLGRALRVMWLRQTSYLNPYRGF
jgi:hypothetical protein